MRIEKGPLRDLLVSAGTIVAFLLAQRLGGLYALLTQVALAAWALTSCKASLQALSLIWLAAMLSWYLVPPESLTYARQFKWLILALAAARAGWDTVRHRNPFPRQILYLALLTATAALTSLVASFDLPVSLFKLLAFLVGSSTVILAFSHLRSRGEDLTPWFMALAIVVAGLSLLLVRSPLGYKYIFRSPSPLFRGILAEPQELAVFLSPLIGWLAARVVIGRATLASGLALGVLGYLLIASGSRTGVMASFGSLVLMLGYALLMRPDWRMRLVGGLARPAFVTLFAAAGLLAVTQADVMTYTVNRLVYKRAGTLSGEFHASRGFLVDQQLANFAKSPWVGIGFGMPSDPHDLARSPHTVLGIPLGAPVEKGVLPMAVLEETGILGVLAFLPVIAGLLAAISRAPWPSAVVATAVLLNNLGEANFFAFGGMGLYYWLILGQALYGTPPEAATVATPQAPLRLEGHALPGRS